MLKYKSFCHGRMQRQERTSNKQPQTCSKHHSNSLRWHIRRYSQSFYSLKLILTTHILPYDFCNLTSFCQSVDYFERALRPIHTKDDYKNYDNKDLVFKIFLNVKEWQSPHQKQSSPVNLLMDVSRESSYPINC